MKLRKFGLFSVVFAMALAMGCAGADGQDGEPGTPGEKGESGEPGEKGDPGEDAVSSPSLSGIFPAHVFVARSATIQISGFGTEWDAAAAPEVKLGDDIEVKKVTVASPTSLFVDIDVKDTAKTQLYTVEVGTLKLTDSLLVESPLKKNIVFSGGDAARGSVFYATFSNADLNNLFDVSINDEGEYNTSLEPMPGFYASTTGLSILQLEAMMFAHPHNGFGKQTPVIVSGVDPNVVKFPGASESFDVPDREPTVLNEGATGVKGKIANPNGTALFSHPGIPGKYAYFTVTFESITHPDGIPTWYGSASAIGLFSVSEKGKFDNETDLRGMITEPSVFRGAALPDSTIYNILYDLSGEKDHEFKISRIATVPFAKQLDQPATGGTSSANAIEVKAASEIPFLLTKASIKDETASFWLKLTDVPAGKKIRVATLSGNTGHRSCETVVRVYNGNNTSSPWSTSSDYDYHEDHLTPNTPNAGTYFVRISTNPSYFEPTENTYEAIIDLE